MKGEEVITPKEREEPAAVGDLMEALRASVEAVKSGKNPPDLAPKKESRKKSGSKGGDLDSLSKQELLEIASELDIPGRSSMDKKKLIRAITRARSAAA